MRVPRLLALVVLCVPLAAAAGDLDKLFPSLVQQAATQVTPIITINGGSQPGVFTAQGGVSGTFDSTAPLNNLSSQVAGQFQRFPVGSTVAAFTFQFDPELNVFTRSTEGLGPLLSERAPTLGKGKINVSFSYSRVDFKVFEREKLNHVKLPFAGAILGASGGQTGTDFPNGTIIFSQDMALAPGQQLPFQGSPSGTFTGDGIAGVYGAGFTDGSVGVSGVVPVLNADLAVDVFAFFLNYGVTDWLDIGAVIPLMNVDGSGQVTTYGLTDPNTGVPLGPVASPREHDNSFGFGDILLRAKARLFTTKFVDGALRGDLSLPTGDEHEFRGYGDPAFGPTFVFSKTFGWVSPHANIGLNFRTDDPDQHTWRWATGIDVQPFEVFTVTADVIGEHLIDRDVNIGEDIYAFSGGLKVNPWSRLVVSGNALVRLNRDGLRADVIPAVSLEYTFQ
jgi:hypothetical protein